MRSLPDHSLAGLRAAPVRSSRLRALVRAVLLVGVTLLLLPLFIIASGTNGLSKRLIRRSWCRFCCWLLGLDVRYRGAPVTACATLFVANHVSYLDIVLVGRRTDATFIAKAEVAAWPLFGTIGRAASTFFIRRRWRDALIQRNALAARLRAGESFILFAEGTSTDGLDVQPFKTSLLSVAEPWIMDRPIAIQPVSLSYRRLRDGTPIGKGNCHRYAWIGEDAMLPHLWALLHERGCTIEVTFGEPELSWAVKSRKELGRHLHGTIASHVRQEQPRPLPEMVEQPEPQRQLAA